MNARKSQLPPLSLALAILGLGWAPAAAPHDGPHAGHGGARVDFPVPCSAPAQAAFNEAVTLLHHMTYPQARQGFERVLAVDPDCAMAHWGVAMTLFQPLWPTRPGPEALQLGWDHVQQALALAPAGRERAFIASAQAFFLEPGGTDYWLRIRRWEAASAEAYRAFPGDDEIAAFYALAHLATSPANAVSRTNADEAAAILLKVYEHKPGHPGAMHYLVHANDVPGRERELLDITRQYEAAAPDNPHALHMPTHIYTRLGEWDSVIRGNLRAADAALRFPAGDKGELVWDEFAHAIEYLVYAYLQKGADADALAQVQRLQGTANLQPGFKTAFHLASTQARYALERKDWPQAAALVPGTPASVDWSRFAWPEAIVLFAHGLGSARVGKLGEAKAVADRLAVLESATRKGGEDLFARNIQMLRLQLEAWSAQAGGDPDLALARMGEAVALEAATPKHAVTPGPTLPGNEQLGDLLMEQHQPAPALAAYRKSLQAYPKRFNSLLGAARASQAGSDKAQARAFYRELIAVAGAGTRAEPLAEARAYLED
jgi:tetratricopeptide (TPR) repeat protein